MSCYLIKSDLTGFVLDCEGGGNKPGAKVIPFDKHGGDNQQWYDDYSTGTIRSKAGNLCLDIQNDQLVVKPYQPGASNQQWTREGKFIRNRTNNQVLDVLAMNKEKGAKIGSWQHNGGPNQSWTFENCGGPAPQMGASTGYPSYPGGASSNQQFFIKSKMHGKVLDVSGGNTAPGTKVTMWDKHSKPEKNQLWYTDPQGHIVSALNHLGFGNDGSGQGIKTMAVSGPRSQFYFQGETILNRAGECLDISRGNKDNGAEVISFKSNNAINQQWVKEFA